MQKIFLLISHEHGWHWTGISVSTSAYVLKRKQKKVWMVEQKHPSNNSANDIVDTRLSDTPLDSELWLMKSLNKNGSLLVK